MSEGEQLDLLALDRALSPAERRRLRNRRAGQKRGYAHHPGTGPAGETCGSCRFIAKGRRFAKCELMRAKWTHSYGTDVLVRAPACSKWEGRISTPSVDVGE